MTLQATTVLPTAHEPRWIDVTVAGTSMAPLLSPGQHILFQEVTSSADIHVGAVALIRSARQADEWIVHRLVGQMRLGTHRYFLHQGDHSPIPGIAHEREIVAVAPQLTVRRPSEPSSTFRFGFFMLKRIFARLSGGR